MSAAKYAGGDEPAALGAILAELRRTTDLGLQLDRAQLWEKWPQVAGPTLCTFGRPVKFKKKKLYVETDSAVWMHRYAYARPALLERINRLAGYELVTEIHISLRPDALPEDPQDNGAEDREKR